MTDLLLAIAGYGQWSQLPLVVKATAQEWSDEDMRAVATCVGTLR